MTIAYEPIGTIRSPFTTLAGMPIQPFGAKDVPGRIELRPELADGLRDLAEFSHVILLYHLHLVTESALVVTPFLDDRPHGIFATRSPKRPNPIGLSVVRLLGIEGTTLAIADVDVLDGTPLLDLKPFVPLFDNRETERIGWFATRAQHAVTARADARFTR